MRTGERGTLRADHQVPDCRTGLPGNERLTVMTGAVLLVLFIAEYLTGCPRAWREGGAGG